MDITCILSTQCEAVCDFRVAVVVEVVVPLCGCSLTILQTLIGFVVPDFFAFSVAKSTSMGSANACSIVLSSILPCHLSSCTRSGSSSGVPSMLPARRREGSKHHQIDSSRARKNVIF